MKKLCNIVKVWVVAVAFGETVASYYKDKGFKTKLDDAKGFDKCRVVFNNLLDVNKKFFTEVSSVDYNTKYSEVKSNIEHQIDEFNKKLDNIKLNINDYKEEKISPVLEDIYVKATKFKERIETEVVDLKDKYDLDWKLNNVKEKVSNLKEKIQK